MSLDSEGLVEVPGVTSHYARLSNGAKAHFSTAGHHGPAVILCHGGLPGSSGIAGFRNALPFLGQNGFRVYAPDFPGFGLSDNREEYWPRLGGLDHVDFIQRFADALCLEDFHITGNSMGCTNTLNYVLAHPERVRNFILLAGTVGDIVDPSLKRQGSMDVRALNRDVFDGSEAGMRRVMEGLVQDVTKIPEDVVKMRTSAANRQRESLKAYWNYGDNLAREPRFRARTTSVNRIDRIGIPALYAWGIDDRMSPVQNGFVDEDATPNIQYFYPEGAGHQLQNDRPEFFNPLFLEFFRDGKVSWKTALAAGVSRRRPINPALVEEPRGGFPQPIWDAYDQPEKLRQALSATLAGSGTTG
jgi:2-hydroxy-6-oxonona-2,4-dienedioate hydrolase